VFGAFTDTQDQLRELARDYLRDKSPESEVRRLMATEEGYDPAVWKQTAQELGLQGIAIPEQYGGQGYGWVELGVVLEEMGRALVCAPFFSTVVLAATTLLESGDEEAKQQYLPGIVDGSLIATVALTEENGRWDEDGVTLPASHSADGWTLSGAKHFVLDGAVAQLLIVPARTASGVSLFAVDATASGLTRTPSKTLDETRKLAVVELDATPGRLIGAEGGGWPVLTRVLDFAAIALAAEQAGGAQAALDMSVDYLKTRVQFGQVIGAFQALKHMAADVLIEVESAKSAAYYALDAAAEDNDELAAAASLAKAYCSDAFVTAAHQNIQFHGGMGFTWEVPAHLYYKRARSSEVFLGDPVAHREALAQRIGIERSGLTRR
jgi:alkylation response protein AidB-like acyl-CoA dehydrogenase